MTFHFIIKRLSASTYSTGPTYTVHWGLIVRFILCNYELCMSSLLRVLGGHLGVTDWHKWNSQPTIEFQLDFSVLTDN